MQYAGNVSYPLQKTIVLSALAFVFFSAFYNEYVAHNSEYYPFFSWSLFSKIPNPRNDFSIQVHQMQGRVFTPAQPFRDLRPLFENIGQSPTQYTSIISDLGNALVHGNEEVTRTRRATLEKIFGTEPFSYDVLAVTFDPLVAYKEQRFGTTTIIATFSGNQ